MQAGTLTKRITLQKPGNAVDDYGQPVPGGGGFDDVATVWAAIRPMGSNERVAAAQTQSGQTHVITVRYTAAQAAAQGSWRIVFGTRAFGIVGLPRCPDERREWLVFDCTERTNG